MGGFPPEIRLELLAGQIIDMSPQRSDQASAFGLVQEPLRGCFGAGFRVRGQMPLALDERSEPEPDVAVVRGDMRDYVDRHPETAVLVVEVADTSLAFDRMSEGAAYARDGIRVLDRQSA